MDSTAEQVAQNAAVFREANEQIRAAALRHDVRERVPFLCECPDPGCTEVFRMSLDEYEDVRSNPTRFLNALGHEAAWSDRRVAATQDEYVVVEPIGPAAELLMRSDPRGRSAA